MKPKTIVIAIIACLVFIFILVWGYNKNGNTPIPVPGVTTGEKSALTASEESYDFGTIAMKNGNVTKDFVLANATDKDVNIKGVETSCMCTSASLVRPDGKVVGPFGMAGMGGMTSASQTIKAGENWSLRVVYDPNAHGPAGVGEVDRFVTVTDADGGTLQFEVKALVTP